MTSEEEERPSFITGGYGRHRCQWVNRVVFKKTTTTTRPLHYQSQHASVTTTFPSCKTHLEAIMISRCQGGDTFITFQLMGIFCFWRNGEWAVPEKIHTPPTDGILEILMGGGSKTLEIQAGWGVKLEKDFSRGHSDQ